MSDEPQGIDPYDAVLADLRSKRDQIDSAIAAIEALRGGIGQGAPRPAARQESPSGVGAGDLLGLSIADAAKKVLAIKRTPLRSPDIWVLFQAGGLVLNSKEPANTIGSVLTRRAEDTGDIVRVGRGLWGLKEWYPGRSFKKEKGDNGEAPAAEAEEAKVATTGL
jgi:HB1, ASXL, restriction endonuclease HTH domain